MFFLSTLKWVWASAHIARWRACTRLLCSPQPKLGILVYTLRYVYTFQWELSVFIPENKKLTSATRCYCSRIGVTIPHHPSKANTGAHSGQRGRMILLCWWGLFKPSTMVKKCHLPLGQLNFNYLGGALPL